MPRYELNLRDYYRILRRHWIVIFIVSLGLGGITFFSSDDDVAYQASATIRIRQQSNMVSLLMQTFYWSPTDNLGTQIRLITSQPSLLEIAKTLDDYIPPAGGEPSIPDTLKLDQAVADADTGAAESTRKKEADRALSQIRTLSGILSAAQVEQSGLIRITATLRDPNTDPGDVIDRAIKTAKAAAQGFQEYNRLTSTRQAEATQNFLETRKQSLDDEIAALQEDLRVARQTSPTLPSQDAASLNPLINRRLDLRDRITTLRDQRSRIEQGGISSSASSLQNTAALIPYAETFRRISQLQTERNLLLQTYTEQATRVLEIDTQLEEIRRDLIVSLELDIQMYGTRLDSLDHELQAFPQSEVNYANLQRQLEIKTQLLTQVELQYQEASVRLEEEGAGGEVEIVDYPLVAVATGGTSGQGIKGIIGMLLGLMLGIVVAFIAESMDTSIGTIEDVEEYIEVPVLAVIPHLAVEKMEERLVEQNPQLKDDPNLHMYARLITQYDPKSPSAEAYRTLRTNLQFATAGAGEDMEVKNTFVFTSSDLQEGKTTTLVNLAITIAQAGNRVLLMGCNMRRPTIYKSFGLPLATGMTDILTGSKEWRECVKGVTDMMVGPLSLQNIMSMPGLDNLHIITSGGVPPNPSELLNSKRFGQMIEEASEEYDIVLVDCPPILPVTDAAIVGRQVDWAVLIYQVGKVARNALRRAKLHLSNVGAHVLGIAMNDVRAEISGYSPYSQYMTKYYGEGAGEKKSLRQRVRGLFKKEEVFGERRLEERPETHRIKGRDESGPAWIDVDYYGNGEKSEAGEESLSALPYSAETPEEPAPAEPDSTFEPEVARETGEVGEKTGLFASIPLWGWIALGAAVIVLIASLLLDTCSETTAAALPPATQTTSPATAGADLPTVQAPRQEQTPVQAAGEAPGSDAVWSILVGSFQSTAEAHAFLDRLRSAEPALAASAWSRLEEVPDLGRWNRVYIGQYADRAECTRTAETLSENGVYPLTLVRRVTPPTP